MAETFIESKAEQAPLTITEKVDAALGYDYEQVQRDAAELAERTNTLVKRLRAIEGSDADPRWGSLMLTIDNLGQIVFDLLNGDRLAQQDAAPSGEPIS